MDYVNRCFIRSKNIILFFSIVLRIKLPSTYVYPILMYIYVYMYIRIGEFSKLMYGRPCPPFIGSIPTNIWRCQVVSSVHDDRTTYVSTNGMACRGRASLRISTRHVCSIRLHSRITTTTTTITTTTTTTTTTMQTYELHVQRGDMFIVIGAYAPFYVRVHLTLPRIFASLISNVYRHRDIPFSS